MPQRETTAVGIGGLRLLIACQITRNVSLMFALLITTAALGLSWVGMALAVIHPHERRF